MRSTVELTALPYSFALNRLLMPDKFLSEFRERGVHLDRHRLEALHRTRVLIPLLRLRRDGREIAAEFRRSPREAWAVAHWQPTSRWDLDKAVADGRLFDPAQEQFISRERLTWKIGEVSYETSVYLYSPQQLVYAPLIQELLPSLQLRARGGLWVGTLTAHAAWKARWLSQAKRLRELALAVLALEPIYFSQVMGVLRLDSGRVADWDAYAERYYEWRRKQPLGRPLRWLGVNAQWIADGGIELLRLARVLAAVGAEDGRRQIPDLLVSLNPQPSARQDVVRAMVPHPALRPLASRGDARRVAGTHESPEALHEQTCAITLDQSYSLHELETASRQRS